MKRKFLIGGLVSIIAIVPLTTIACGTSSYSENAGKYSNLVYFSDEKVIGNENDRILKVYYDAKMML